jgi:PEP-CTERM motif
MLRFGGSTLSFRHAALPALLFGAAVLAAPADAGQIVWNFGANPTSSTNSVDYLEVPGAVAPQVNWLGHSATWGTGVKQVKVWAYSLPLPPASLPSVSNAYIQQTDLNSNNSNAAGIGVCSVAQTNASNRAICSNAADNPQLDNDDAYDVFLFQFAAASVPVSITLSGWNNGDAVEVWTSNSPNADLTSLSTIAAGFVPGNPNPMTISISGPEPVEYLILGASRHAPHNDEFRVLSITVLPEPGSIALLGMAALGLVAARRRRRAQ